jgi:hypothetical protein
MQQLADDPAGMVGRARRAEPAAIEMGEHRAAEPSGVQAF